jgi:hypothetical protein
MFSIGFSSGDRGRQGQEGDVLWHGEGAGHVPAGLVEDDHGVCAGVDHGTDLGKVGGHGRGVAAWHDQTRALARLRADGSENIGRLRALVVRRRRSCAAPCPAAGDRVLLADPGLILEPQLYCGALGKRLADFRQPDGEVFLKAAISSAFWA